MKSVGEAFQQFIQDLQLTEKQKQEVVRQHTVVRDKLRERLKSKAEFLSGSYSRGTAIRPLHDIDLFLVLGDSPSTPPLSPQAALEQVQQAFKAAWPDKEMPILQQHSVHLGFSTSRIEFDVVPAYQQPGQPVYYIPERQGGRWIRSSPKQHEELSRQVSGKVGPKLKPLIRAAKHWNRRQSPRLASFHLEIMSYGAFTQDPGSYLEGLEALFAYLSRKVLEPCPDPAGLGPNVDKRLGPEERQQIRKRLAEAAQVVRRAREAQEPKEAHQLLRGLFGTTYPA